MSLRKKNLFKGAENWSGIDIKENITLILIMLLHKKNENYSQYVEEQKKWHNVMSDFLFCVCIHIK